MASTPLKALATLVLVAAVAGCASKKTDDSAQAGATTGAQSAGAEQAQVQGADVAPAQGAVTDIGWEGFENNPANYTGDTRTRVIYFAFDRSEIPQAAYATLKAHARHLAANPSARVRLEGHADERGTPEYNVALAERRNRAVEQFLTLNGAKAGQLESVSYGEEKPAALGGDELSWAKNRRVELVYTAGQP